MNKQNFTKQPTINIHSLNYFIECFFIYIPEFIKSDNFKNFPHRIKSLWILALLFRHLNKYFIKIHSIFVAPKISKNQFYQLFANRVQELFVEKQIEELLCIQYYFQICKGKFISKQKISQNASRIEIIIKEIVLQPDLFNINFFKYIPQLLIGLTLLETQTQQCLIIFKRACSFISLSMNKIKYNNNEQLMKIIKLIIYNIKREEQLLPGILNYSLLLEEIEFEFFKSFFNQIKTNQLDQILNKVNDLNIMAHNLLQLYFGPKTLFFLLEIINKLLSLNRIHQIQIFYLDQIKNKFLQRIKSKISFKQVLQILKKIYLVKQIKKQNIETDISIMIKNLSFLSPYSKKALCQFIQQLYIINQVDIKKIENISQLNKHRKQIGMKQIKSKKLQLIQIQICNYQRLPNLVQSNYINSVLISLYMIITFRDFIYSIKTTQLNYSSVTMILKYIYNSLTKANNKKQKNYYQIQQTSKLDLLKKFKDNLKEPFKTSQIQQDVFQFYQSFLQTILKQLSFQKSQEMIGMVNFTYHLIIICQNNHTIIKIEEKNQLIFDILIHDGKTINDLIRLHYVEQKISNYFCQFCNRNVYSKRNSYYQINSKILIICLKRFYYKKQMKKSQKLFCKIILNQNLQFGNIKYSLKCFITHTV